MAERRIKNAFKNSVKKVLPWDRRRWKEEINIYLAQWNHAHALPIRRAEVLAQRKIISFKALGAVLSPTYYKIVSVRKRRKSSEIT
jgi:hypothetical protein